MWCVHERCEADTMYWVINGNRHNATMPVGGALSLQLLAIVVTWQLCPRNGCDPMPWPRVQRLRNLEQELKVTILRQSTLENSKRNKQLQLQGEQRKLAYMLG